MIEVPHCSAADERDTQVRESPPLPPPPPPPQTTLDHQRRQRRRADPALVRTMEPSTPSSMARVHLTYLVAALALFASLCHHYYGPLDLSQLLGRSRPRVPVIFAVSTQSDRIRQRRVVRATWKSTLPPSSKLIFFGGDKQCEVDPYWRLRAGACVGWNVFVPASINEGFPVRPYRVSPSRLGVGPAADGVGFRLKFPISVTQLGISKRALHQFVTSLPPSRVEQGHEADLKGARHLFRNITVDLLDPLTNDVYVSANFSQVELMTEQSDDGFIYAKVVEDTYSRHFEGAVRVRQHDALRLNRSLSCNVIWNKMFGEDGVVPVESLWSGGRSLPASPAWCPHVSLVYHIPDMPELRQVVNSRDTQNKCQRNKNRNMASKIVEEMEDYDDLQLIPRVVDTEENRPRALLGFLRSVLDRFDFDFVVVTDDATFLAADQLVSHVLSDFVPANAWRSAFRRRVPVQHYGEFPETRYSGAEYPALPSPAGSVLSRSLVEHLVRNADHLVPMRDLASSLGVWLSSFDVQLIEDEEFAADNVTCGDGSGATVKAFGPVSEKTLMALWDNYKRCRRICSCPANTQESAKARTS